MQTYESSDGTITTGAIERGFDNHDSGQSYSMDLQQHDWDVAFGETTAENASISDEYAVSGDHSLKVTYQDDQNEAAASSWVLPEEDTYYLSYWVMFEEDFDFDGDDHSGGKLPGLASEGLASGGSNVTGENGFTARYMWREDGAAELYLYHMDKPGKFGESFEFVDDNGDPIKFEPGEWHQLTQRVTVNDQGRSNGEVAVWMDGVQVLDLDELRFVTDGSGVDRLYFSSFFGGGDDGWLPDDDVSAYFDDIVVSTDPADVGLGEQADAGPQINEEVKEEVVVKPDAPVAPAPATPEPVDEQADGAEPEINFDVSKSWTGGFKAELSITNTTADTMDDWLLQLQLDGFEIEKLWSADLNLTNDKAQVSGIGRETDIAPGETVEIGFVAEGAPPAQMWDFAIG